LRRREAPLDNASLPAQFQKLIDLHKPLGPPQSSGGWRRHEEPGKTIGNIITAGGEADPPAAR